MPRALRIVFLNNFSGAHLGGGEVQLLGLLPGLVAGGLRPVVVCASGSALQERARQLAGVAVVPADFSRRGLLPLLLCLPCRLRRAQVVSGTGFLTGLVAAWVGFCTASPVVNVVHVVPGAARHEGEPAWACALRRLMTVVSRRYVARLIAVSRAVEDGLLADGVSVSPVTLIPNGVNAAALRREADAAQVRAGREGAPRVGFLGRLERIKGADTFVEAAARLADQFPTATFVVGGEGSRRAELEELATTLGLSGRLTFAGFVSSAPRFLAGLDVVLVPSRSEALGMTALEAMALGLPVVASRVGGLPEVVQHGVTGYLVPPGDPGALAATTAHVLVDAALAERLGAAGRLAVDERFSLDRMVAAYVALYREVAGAPA